MHSLAPNPVHFCGRLSKKKRDGNELRVASPFWYRAPICLRYLWIREASTNALAIQREYAIRCRLSSTLLTDLNIIDAVRIGDAAAIKRMLEQATSTQKNSDVEDGSARDMALSRCWVPAVLAAAAHIDVAIQLLNEGVWDVPKCRDLSLILLFALRENQIDFVEYLADPCRRCANNFMVPLVTTVSMFEWIVLRNDPILFPNYFLPCDCLTWRSSGWSK
ncbi:hypothetical protein AMAG_13206 [Allomyces macrogynus ATCC 38327]|uniref:Uncharacterized protein n=1 Tax=Allomyces macrogynus (strain ATCC 38327) TaxID=578462 RepID=A0A0L0T0D2_ALLM3|nr:hypothetical protein AMAG_13206 [Allomyces macrogynus ATCC 38327]|eukprot:KNE68034.1 hypothetical protein AMAG_13206 [Allomyces macrogynus ATCC 38327]